MTLISNISPRILQAQTVESPSVPRLTPAPTPSKPPELPNLPSPEELLPLPSPTPSNQEELPTTDLDTIVVEKFAFIGNTAFTQEQLAAVTEPFTQRPISFAQLLEARSAVTKLYVDGGYVTSGAYIPLQTIEGGIVTIAILEGSVEAINLEVTGKLDPNYVRDRLELATGTPLNVNRLLESLQMLQLDPLIEKVSADLSKGVRPGTSILDVKIEQASTFQVRTTLDNSRVPSVGSFRRSLEVEEANLLGYGDDLKGTYRNTDGSNDVEVSYAFPVNPRNGTLKLNYRQTWSEIIESPFDQLDINSDYQKYAISFQQPWLQSPRREFILGVSAEYQNSETTLLGVPFPLSPGADERGRTQISTVRFFQQWTQRSEVDVFALRSELSLGLEVLGSTINASSPDSRYLLWRGQTQWVRLLALDTILLIRADWQLADRPLLPLEQFTLGGIDTVRGYRQDQLLTDNGLFASVELRLPIFRAPEPEMVLQIVPFIDFGTGWNNGDFLNPDPNTLASFGLGLRYQIGDRLSAQFDWGIPLVDVDSQNNNLQEQGLYFSLDYRFF